MGLLACRGGPCDGEMVDIPMTLQPNEVIAIAPISGGGYKIIPETEEGHTDRVGPAEAKLVHEWKYELVQRKGKGGEDTQVFFFLLSIDEHRQWIDTLDELPAVVEREEDEEAARMEAENARSIEEEGKRVEAEASAKKKEMALHRIPMKGDDFLLKVIKTIVGLPGEITKIDCMENWVLIRSNADCSTCGGSGDQRGPCHACCGTGCATRTLPADSWGRLASQNKLICSVTKAVGQYDASRDKPLVRSIVPRG